jgi:hypothetical protein
MIRLCKPSEYPRVFGDLPGAIVLENGVATHAKGSRSNWVVVGFEQQRVGCSSGVGPEH